MRRTITGARQPHYSFKPPHFSIRKRETSLKLLPQIAIGMVHWNSVEQHHPICIFVRSKISIEFSEQGVRAEQHQVIVRLVPRQIMKNGIGSADSDRMR